MQLSTLITAAMAAAVSATQDAESSAQATGVTFYEHIDFNGQSYEIPSLNRCWTLPTTLARKTSSVLFSTSGVGCALFRNAVCLVPPIYSGLRESVPNLQDLGLGDEVASVFCGAFNDEK